VPGRLVGVTLLLLGVIAIVRRGLMRPPPSRTERLGVALVLFSLGCATLAALGRSEIDPDVLVPVRYSVLVTPLHLGLLLLVWPALERWATTARRTARVHAVLLTCAVLLCVQQIVAGQAAVATTRAMRATLARFADGEQTDDMRRVVFVNLEQARRQADRIRSEGLYLSVR
jgi:hypothetical protein